MFMLFASWPVLGYLGPLHRVGVKGAIWENNGKENGVRNTTFVHIYFKNRSDDFTEMLYPLESSGAHLWISYLMAALP